MKTTNRPIPLKPVRKRQHGAMPKSIEEKILDGTLDIWEERDRLIKQRLERGVLIERKLPTCENKPPDSCEPEVYMRRIETYAKRVVSGEIVANRLVKLACERHLKDLERSRTDPKYPYFFELRENNICEFAEQQVHIKGSWARETEPGRIPFIVLEDWQVFMLGVLFGWRKRKTDHRRFHELYAEIPRKNGKALALNTPIPTPNGWTTQGELKIGDEVFGPDGSIRRIVATTEVMENRPCYRLTTWDGEVIIADAEHQWLTDSRRDRDSLKGVRGKTAGPKPSIKTTKEIAETILCRDELNHRILISQPVECEERLLSIPPYVLGAWLGDGTSLSATITIGAFDQAEMVSFIQAVGQPIQARSTPALFSLSSGRNRSNKYGLHARLRAANLLGNKHVPSEYLRSSIHQRMELLRGLMDTDGTVSKAGQCTFTTTSPRLAADVEELLWSLGFKPTIRKRPAKLYGRVIGPQWDIQFWASSDQPVFKLSRKLARLKPTAKSLTRSRTRQITSCEPVESVPVKCVTVDHEDGIYLAGRTFLPTHNSIAGAIIGLYMAFADDEVGAEAYAGAGSLAQAMQVFKPAYLMIRRNPWIRERYDLGVSGTDQNPSRIFQYATGSMFEPVIGKPGDGPSPHCAIIDEYHEHTSPDLYDTMKTGMGARRQPLRIVITTAGVNTSGPCYEKHLEAIKMLEGTYENDELFALIFTLDDDDDWEDFDVWKKVNPNFNVSVFEDYLKSQHRDAINKLSDRNINRTKHLNQWLNAGVGWMDMIKWQTCCDASMTLDQFAGQECWLAVDAANKVDIMSLAILFRLKTGGFALFSKNYLCKETIDKPENSHYRLWRDAGWLIEAGSARTDHRLIHDDIKALSSRFAIQQLAYDPRESNYLISTIEEWASFACVEIQQGHALMSEPMKEMEALIYSGALRHADDPCLTWQMSNVVKKQGSAGVVKYYYPSKERDANKIDAIVAGIMALGRAMVNERTKEPEFQAMFF